MDKEKDFIYKIRLNKLLLDSITGLPTIHSLMPNFVEELELQGSIGFITIGLLNDIEIEKNLEIGEFDNVVKRMAEYLKTFKKNEMEDRDFLFVKNSQSSDFVLGISSRGIDDKNRITTGKIYGVRNRLRNYIYDNLRRIDPSGNIKETDVLIGTSRIVYNPLLKVERQISSSIERAKFSSSYKLPDVTMEMRKKLTELINNKLLNTFFLAIVELETGQTMGYEALNRPKTGSGFDLTESLYLWADRFMLDLQLDMVCIEQAFKNSKHILKKNSLIFLNTFAKTIENPSIILNQLLKRSKELGLNPENIILEMTERTAIEDMNLFKKMLIEYKNNGFRIAVDDVGAGYSSLNTIAHLKPEFLKFDIALVRNIHRDPIKQQLLKTVMEMARGIDAIVIAEGIERKEELDAIKDFGVKYGQGYLFGNAVRSGSE